MALKEKYIYITSTYLTICCLVQWYSTWSARNSRVTQRHLKEYAKSSYRVRKIKEEKYIVSWLIVNNQDQI
jgi:hypothetical protein